MSIVINVLSAALLAGAQPAGSVAVATPLGLSDSPAAFQGTLLTPRARAKARPVLIIAGSGPTDRNGDSLAFGVRAQPYKLLAEGLAARGVTTLRYDKRGIGGSKGAGGRAEDLRLQHYADDARAWAARLKAKTRADCVWLLGHSEGALLAEMAALNNPDACGLVLVAAPGRRISEVLREQLRASPANAPLLPVALPAVAELEAGRTVDSSGFPAALQPLFHSSLQPFLISMMQADPVALLRNVKTPVLIVQGTTDLQTGVVDADLLAAANPKAKLVKLEGVNHVLKSAPADRTQNMATYGDASLPLAPGVVDTVAGFLLAHSPKR